MGYIDRRGWENFNLAAVGLPGGMRECQKKRLADGSFIEINKGASGWRWVFYRRVEGGYELDDVRGNARWLWQAKRDAERYAVASTPAPR